MKSIGAKEEHVYPKEEYEKAQEKCKELKTKWGTAYIVPNTNFTVRVVAYKSMTNEQRIKAYKEYVKDINE